MGSSIRFKVVKTLGSDQNVYNARTVGMAASRRKGSAVRTQKLGAD